MSESIHLGEAVLVMRQAPQEFSMVLKQKSANHLVYIYMFLVIATPRRPGISDQESEIFLRIVQSLLNFAATVLPPGHPLHQVLRSLAKWETEDMGNFVQNHLNCQSLEQFYPLGIVRHSLFRKEVGGTRSSSFTTPLPLSNLTASVPIVCSKSEPCKQPHEPCWHCFCFKNPESITNHSTMCLASFK